jgi:hypothetical protein
MTTRKSSGKRMPPLEAEIKPNPESEKVLREREAIAEREKLLDELGLCFVQAAVTNRITTILVSTAGIVYGTDGVPIMCRGTTIRALQTLPEEHIALLERIRAKLAAN